MKDRAISIFDELRNMHERRRVLLLQKRHSSYSLQDIEKSLDDQYYAINKRKIDWCEPKSFTEKINVYKVHQYNEEKMACADKYEVRKWAEERIGKEYLIPVHGLYDRFDDIVFRDLPDCFVIKCTHDCNSTTLVENKKEVHWGRMKRQYDYFQKVNLAYLNFELHYKNIRPRIMIEENLGSDLDDYKFLCFDGTPYYCWVDRDRQEDHKRTVFDANWEEAPFRIGAYKRIQEKIEKPENFDLMIEIAKKLSKGFSHVRVDLYNKKGRIYFGEMTFTTANGMIRFLPEEYDYYLGSLWKLEPYRKNSKEIESYLCNE